MAATLAALEGFDFLVAVGYCFSLACFLMVVALKRPFSSSTICLRYFTFFFEKS